MPTRAWKVVACAFAAAALFAGCGGPAHTSAEPVVSPSEILSRAKRTFEIPESLKPTFEALDEMLAQPEEKIDVARASFLIAKAVYPEVDVEGCLRKLDEMAAELRPAVAAASTPEAKIKAISRYVHRVKGLRGTGRMGIPLDLSEPNAAGWLHVLLSTGKGNCAGMTALYLALGYRTGVPLRPVIAPWHVFVRYEAAGTRINIETTDEGRSVPDIAYADLTQYCSLGPGTAYMRPLSKSEYLAIRLSGYASFDHMVSERWGEALAYNEKALELFVSFPEIWVNRGACLRGLGRPEDAVASYDQALKLNPKSCVALSNRGNALKDLGRYEEAAEDYRKALRIKPDYSAPRNGLAGMLSVLGRTVAAADVLDAVKTRDPKGAEALVNKATALGNRGRHEEALPLYDKAIELLPDHPVVWANKGNSLNALGRFKEAVVCYDKAIAIKPDYANAWTSKGAALCRMGKIKEGMSAIERSVELDPNDPRTWFNKAVTHTNLKQYAEGLKCFEKCQALGMKLPPGALEQVRDLAREGQAAPNDGGGAD